MPRTRVGRTTTRSLAVGLAVVAAAVMAGVLASCSEERVMQALTSESDRAFTTSCIDHLRRREFEAIEAVMDPSLRTAGLRRTLESMADLVPPSAPRSVKVVGSHTFYGDGETVVNTTLEYEFDGRWLLANVVAREAAGQKRVVGFNVLPQPASLKAQHRFTLRGKGPAHALVLAAAAAAVTLTLTALVACVRTRGLRRKWLWVLFILVGIGQVGVNWTTGAWFGTPLAFQLFAAGAKAQFYGPWLISFSLPLGAIVFLVRRATARPPTEPAGDAEPPRGEGSAPPEWGGPGA